MGANQRSFGRRCVDAAYRCARSARLLPAGLHRFTRLSTAERGTTFHALTVLLYVEATIRWTRLPRLSRTLGIALQPETGTNCGSNVPQDVGGPLVAGMAPAAEDDLPEPVARARRSIGRLMRIWPLGAGPCLRESLVLGHLIRDRSPLLRLGVARHGYRIRAHAWIEIDGQPVNDPQGFVAFDASDA